MKAYLLAIAVVMTAASPSLACTAEDVTAKSTEFSTKMQELAAKDPQKAAEVAQKLSGAQSQLASDPTSACKVYDDVRSG